MSLTLTVGGTTVELDPDLFWSDEFAWSRVSQTVQPSINGALIVQQSVMQGNAGRPITLQPEGDDSAWVSRATLDQLKVWADTPLLTLTLAGLRGTSRSVMFRQQDGALDSRPVVHYSDVEGSDNYLVTLRLMEV
jgi:hypothetical protein